MRRTRFEQIGIDGLTAIVSHQDKMVTEFFQGFKPLSIAHWFHLKHAY